MDENNLEDIISYQKKNQKTNSIAQIKRLGDVTNDGEDVEDPYYGGLSGFESVFKQVSRYLQIFFENYDKNKNK